MLLSALLYFLAGCAPNSSPPPAPVPTVSLPTQTEPGSPSVGSGIPNIRHVFVINLENKNYDDVWDPGSAAPYLAGDLRRQGVLLANYYAVAHKSLPNYLAQISGQPPNPVTEDDCPSFEPVANGSGCVYPPKIPTLANQLDASGRSWKGYMESMDRPCLHPGAGAKDPWRSAKLGSQYATRHDPFVYFRALTDFPGCERNVVDFAALRHDLSSASTTPNLAYITPDLCDDGHDEPCVDGRPGGLRTADTWLSRWVPLITSAPAFADGLLIITFDEAEDDSGDGATPESSAASGALRSDGGRVGALLISPFVKPGTSSTTFYNHYSLLASVEDIFGLPHLGLAQDPALGHFGRDVYNAPGSAR